MNNGLKGSDEKALRIAYLIAGYIRQTLTPAEHDELDRWVEQSDENMLLFEELTDEKNIEAGLAAMQATDSNVAYQKVRSRLSFQKPRKTRLLRTYGIAASVILAIVTLWLLLPSKNPVNSTALTEVKSDLPPASAKAELTLADGRKMILDNQSKGELVNENEWKLVKADSGSIAYSGSHALTTNEMNLLSTPRGGLYQVTLSDGTKVWLNAATSFRYPVLFNERERRVELDGEAYFEVAHDASRPFHVISKNQDITVLGTRFNVNAYRDEEVVKTSLVQGSIKLSTPGEEKTVLPGEQYLTEASGAIRKNPSPDPEGSLAWKEGLFHFRNATIDEILREVSRWYDAEIIYEAKVDKHFNADISRKLPVSKLLSLLEKTGNVHFEIRDKKIKVKP